MSFYLSTVCTPQGAREQEKAADIFSTAVLHLHFHSSVLLSELGTVRGKPFWSWHFLIYSLERRFLHFVWMFRSKVKDFMMRQYIPTLLYCLTTLMYVLVSMYIRMQPPSHASVSTLLFSHSQWSGHKLKQYKTQKVAYPLHALDIMAKDDIDKHWAH